MVWCLPCDQCSTTLIRQQSLAVHVLIKRPWHLKETVFQRVWTSHLWLLLTPPCHVTGVPKYLKGYALCRRPPLCEFFWLRGIAIWGPWCLLVDTLGAILASRNHRWDPFCHLGSKLGRHFSHLGTTLEDHGSSRMDKKLPITGFTSILKWFRDRFLSVFGVQNA